MITHKCQHQFFRFFCVGFFKWHNCGTFWHKNWCNLLTLLNWYYQSLKRVCLKYGKFLFFCSTWVGEISDEYFFLFLMTNLNMIFEKINTITEKKTSSNASLGWLSSIMWICFQLFWTTRSLNNCSSVHYLFINLFLNLVMWKNSSDGIELVM